MLKSNLQRYLSASLVILLSLTFLFFATTGTASAHAKVLSATPAIGSTIATAPTTVTVETAENINPDPKLSNLFVYGPSGDLISQGNAKVSLNNPREMSIQLKPESGGIYVVRWITVSAEDNEADEGAFVFTVKSATTAATPTATGTTPPPTPPPTATNNGFPVAPVSIAAIIALLLGLAAGFGFGRAQARPSANAGSNAPNTAVSEEAPDKVK